MNCGAGAIASFLRPVAMIVGCVAVAILVVANPAEARKKPIHHVVHAARPTGPLPPNSAMEIDADTGQVLFQSNPDLRTYPASLTKLMTLYLLFGALDKGQIKLDQVLSASAHAASMPATSLGLSPGDSLTVEQANAPGSHFRDRFAVGDDYQRGELLGSDL